MEFLEQNYPEEVRSHTFPNGYKFTIRKSKPHIQVFTKKESFSYLFLSYRVNRKGELEPESRKLFSFRNYSDPEYSCYLFFETYIYLAGDVYTEKENDIND